MARTAQQRGKLARSKGRSFEQKIARLLRERFPKATVRRALQSHRAYEPDLVIEGAVSEVVSNLWLELTTGRKAHLIVGQKMEQAHRDISRAHKKSVEASRRIPVVIWHRMREQQVWATLSLRDLFILGGAVQTLLTVGIVEEAPVTLHLEDFLALLPD